MFVCSYIELCIYKKFVLEEFVVRGEHCICTTRPSPDPPILVFWFLVCYAPTQLATPLHQRRIQVVRSNKVVRKRLTESNGTPARNRPRTHECCFEADIRIRRYTNKRVREQKPNA